MFETELDVDASVDSRIAVSVERMLAGAPPDTVIDPTQLSNDQLTELIWACEWVLARIEARQLAVTAELLRRKIAAGASPDEAQQRTAAQLQDTLHISRRTARSLVATAQEVCDQPAGRHTLHQVAS
ncbi:hypothetical protein [Fodinicola acaciae]|uniref:hypothetical protein n=1 Tax=Fodinicola acaciae TaxID=2681555 RepID=UPI0013D12E2C|nr:hypothetical protein [Fodinicola acaciae]